jgi:hypothetical protein
VVGLRVVRHFIFENEGFRENYIVPQYRIFPGFRTGSPLLVSQEDEALVRWNVRELHVVEPDLRLATGIRRNPISPAEHSGRAEELKEKEKNWKEQKVIF